MSTRISSYGLVFLYICFFTAFAFTNANSRNPTNRNEQVNPNTVIEGGNKLREFQTATIKVTEAPPLPAQDPDLPTQSHFIIWGIGLLLAARALRWRK